MEGLRSLVESNEFAKAKAKLLADVSHVKMFDSMMFGVDYVLCSKPDIYGEIAGTNGVRLFATRASDNLPAYKVWYRYDDTTVTLLYIEQDTD